MTIGERLKEERSRLGFSQTDLAKVGGVGKSTQINYEKGSGSPDANYLAAVREQGVDVLYVISGMRTPEKADSFTHEETELIKHVRLLPDEERAGMLRLVSALSATVTKTDF